LQGGGENWRERPVNPPRRERILKPRREGSNGRRPGQRKHIEGRGKKEPESRCRGIRKKKKKKRRRRKGKYPGKKIKEWRKK